MDKKYYSYPKERLGEGRIPVKCLGDSGEVFSEIAHIMVDTIIHEIIRMCHYRQITNRIHRSLINQHNSDQMMK